MIKSKQSHHRVRYVRILENLNAAHQIEPKERYMYRLMDSVIFQDFETALDVVIEDFKNASNDNQNKGEA